MIGGLCEFVTCQVKDENYWVCEDVRKARNVSGIKLLGVLVEEGLLDSPKGKGGCQHFEKSLEIRSDGKFAHQEKQELRDWRQIHQEKN